MRIIDWSSDVCSSDLNFSAPVIVELERNDADLILLAQYDTDPFARWEAGQELATRSLLALVQAYAANEAPVADTQLIDTWRKLLLDPTLTDTYKARVLTLPCEKELLEKTYPKKPQNTKKSSQPKIGKAAVRERVGK